MDTLEFRGILVLIAIAAVAILYFALFTGQRSRGSRWAAAGTAGRVAVLAVELHGSGRSAALDAKIADCLPPAFLYKTRSVSAGG